MNLYVVKVDGCDDSTTVAIELADDEAATIQRVADLVTRMGGGCRPRMYVNPDVGYRDDALTEMLTAQAAADDAAESPQ